MVSLIKGQCGILSSTGPKTLKYVERQRGVFGCGRRVGVGSWAEPTPKRQGIVFTHTLAPLVSCVVRIRDKKGALIFLTQTTNDAFFWAPEPSPDAARVKKGWAQVTQHELSTGN